MGTGRWSAESAMNEWHMSRGRQKPVMYAWMERHAAAGVGVVVSRRGGCLQCGFSSAGEPMLRATEWKDADETREPGCGAVFQTYGPAAVNRVAAVITEMALDCLHSAPIESFQRICTITKKRLDLLGGTSSPEWVRASDNCVGADLEKDLAWVSREGCPECAGAST